MYLQQWQDRDSCRQVNAVVPVSPWPFPTPAVDRALDRPNWGSSARPVGRNVAKPAEAMHREKTQISGHSVAEVSAMRELDTVTLFFGSVAAPRTNVPV